MAPKKIAWTSEEDTRLFLTILQVHNISINYAKVAAAFGTSQCVLVSPSPYLNQIGTTTPAIQQRMFKLRQKAKTMNGAVAGPDSAAPAEPTSRKRRASTIENPRTPRKPKKEAEPSQIKTEDNSFRGHAETTTIDPNELHSGGGGGVFIKTDSDSLTMPTMTPTSIVSLDSSTLPTPESSFDMGTAMPPPTPTPDRRVAVASSTAASQGSSLRKPDLTAASAAKRLEELYPIHGELIDLLDLGDDSSVALQTDEEAPYR